MKRLRLLTFLAALALLLCCVLPTKTEAATSGSYTYTVSGGKATITDYNTSISGKITIPSTLGGYPVTAIGNYAFEYCRSLTAITIPDGVTSIGDGAFSYCSSLTGIWVDENNANYSSDEMGVLFNKNKTQLIQAPGGLAGIYTIPDSVTSIGNNAFYGCSKLTSITILDSVTSIGNNAFYGCSKLTSITIPNSVTSIGHWAFYDCRSLTNINIPDSVCSIGQFAFYECNSLTYSIYDNAKYLGNSKNPYMVLVKSVSTDISSCSIHDDTKFIACTAFSCCSRLTCITIPDGVIGVGDFVFEGCRSLVGITIPDGVTRIGAFAFESCINLTSITIPDSVTSIGDEAFSLCSSLTRITIPNSVTSIGEGAFSYCSSLTGITIPDSVTSIGSSAFYNCSSLTGIWVDENNANYSSDEMGVLFNKNKTQLIQVPGGLAGIYTIPASVTSIGDGAFWYCSSLTAITIPDSVTSIGNYAFYNCSSLKHVAYTGTQSRWSSISIGSNNTTLTNATRHYETRLQEVDNCVERGIYCPVCKEFLSRIVKENGAHNWQAATCAEPKTCTVCSATEGDALGHKAVVDAAAVAPTCTDSGLTEGSRCGVCNVILGVQEEVPALGHSYSAVVTNPTCVNRGYTTHRCHCGDMYIDTYVDALGHFVERPIAPAEIVAFKNDTSYPFKEVNGWYTSTNKKDSSTSTLQLSIAYPCKMVISYKVSSESNYDKLIILKNSQTLYTISGTVSETTQTLDLLAGDILYIKYTKDGSVSKGSDEGYFKVVSCTSKVTENIPADRVEATCESGVICQVCGQTVKAALGHDMSGWSVAKETTCTQSGELRRDCSRCDYYEVEEVAAYGHTVVADAAVAPTCTDSGLTEGSHCSACNTILVAQEIVSPMGHDYEVVRTAPTCTDKGYTTTTCTTCNDTILSDYVDALGHSGDLWFELLPATCTEDGIEARICDVCKSTETRVLIATHHYQSAVTAPNCTEKGFTTNTCAVCSDSYVSDYVDATGHNFGAWVQAIAPGCTVEGSEERTCACGDKESQTIPALGHDYSAEVTAPTCTEKGFTTKTCSACGDVAVTDYVDAKGHGWSAWVEIKASTCTVEGTQVRFCNCGARENAPTQKKPHSYDKEVCTACGYVAQYDWILTEDTAVNRTLAQDLFIDLNGYDLTGTIITNGYKIYGKDSTTDGYACDNIGYFNCIDENGDLITPERTYTEGEIRYMAICNKDRYSFHRYFVGITHMSLEPETVGLGYKTMLLGDDMVFDALRATKAFTFCVQLEGYNPVYRRFDRNELNSGEAIALRIRNYDVENYSEHNLYAQVSLTLNDGTVIETEQVALTFRWLAEQVNANYKDYTPEQLAYFKELLQKFAVTEQWELVQIFGGVAKINGKQYASLEEAVATVKENEVIVLQKNAVVSFVQLPDGTALNLNGYTVSGTVLGKLVVNGGNLITAEGYKMIGADADYYKSENAVITMTASNIVIESGTVTLARSWWTGAGQTLVIEQAATFVIPEGMNLNVNGSTVIVKGTAVVNGSVTLYSKDATVQAVAGLNVVDRAGNRVTYIDNTYLIEAP